ncbi:MAG: ribosome-associated translation inhibitor RaiA [Nocardioides sp.]|nr:ribosome-associated translation inhibitor RaiA [Nocardioides sp.]
MDVVVTGRHCELSERFRDHVADKLGRLEKHDHRIMRVQVEVQNERNPRQADRAVRIELTAYSKGPVIRAEAAAVDKMGALDLAVDKMAAQMRRANDRKVRAFRNRSPMSTLPVNDVSVEDERDAVPERKVASMTVTGEGPLVVRQKIHSARPMTLDQALYEMELVGHDFYLFVDHDTKRPAVVYRRRGYDYGVISLDVDGTG